MNLAEISGDRKKQRKVGAIIISLANSAIMVPNVLLCKRHWQPLLLKNSTTPMTALEPTRTRATPHQHHAFLKHHSCSYSTCAHSLDPSSMVAPHATQAPELILLRASQHPKPQGYCCPKIMHVSDPGSVPAPLVPIHQTPVPPMPQKHKRDPLCHDIPMGKINIQSGPPQLKLMFKG